MPSASDNNKRIAKNTLFMYFRMLITMGVSLYTSRIVLATLGIEDFGIYNIVGGVVVLFSFLNGAMSTATQRFLNFEMGRNDWNEVKRVFGMSMTIHVGIALLVAFLAETVGLWFLNAKLNIPESRMSAANWVYQFSTLTACIGIIRVPYNASIIACERMSFYAYVSIAEVVFKLFVAFSIVCTGMEKLKIYAALICLVAFLTLLLYRFYCIRKLNICRYRFFWDGALCRRLTSFSGWSLFGGVATMSANQGVNMVLNVFHGVALNAAMGIANQVNGQTNNFVTGFQTAFRPQIIKSYAAGDNGYLVGLIHVTSKYSFLLLSLISIPVIINMDFILAIWLETVPDHAVAFCRMFLIYSLINALSGPFWMTVQATGKIRNYQIVISFLVSLNIVFSYVFLKSGFSPVCIFYVRICLDVCYLVARILFVKKFVPVFSVAKYLKKVILTLSAILALPIALVCMETYCMALPEGWTYPVLSSITFYAVYLPSIYFIALEHNERNKIRMTINKILKHV